MSYQFHYSLQGDRRLPVVLFLHGFLGSCDDFAFVIARLPDHCCLAIDLPGHGQTQVTGTDEQYTMFQTAIGIVELLDMLKIDQCSLVGYSMGGRLALYLALNFGERFPAAVLESASPGLRSPVDRLSRLHHDRALAAELEADFPAFLSRWYAQPLFASLRSQPQFTQLMQQRSRNSPAGLAKSLRYLSTGLQQSLWEGLEQHTQPLLLLVGEHDRKFCTLNQEMAQICRSAQVAIVPNCGHVAHLEQPERVVKRVQAFLR